MRHSQAVTTSAPSQKRETFARLIRRWMRKHSFADTVKGRGEAGARLGVSHQTVQNWLLGDLPADTKVLLLAALLDVDEAKLGRVIERDRAERPHAAGESSATVAPPEVRQG